MDRDSSLTEAQNDKSQNEEEWVEAEIERLLHRAEVNDEQEETRPSRTPDFQGIGESWSGDAGVDHVFSDYLSNLGSHQSDVQDLISDAFTALHLATGSLTKRPNDVEEVITDLNLTLCRLEQKENTTVDPGNVETDKKKSFESQLTKESDSTFAEDPKCLLTPDDGLKPAVDSTDKVESSCEPEESVAVVGRLPTVEEGSNSAIVGTEGEIDGVLCDQAGTPREPGDLCDLELEQEEWSEELLTVLEQVRNDQKNCEEQLSMEQKNREAELDLEIEEAQRVIAEYRKAEMERARVLEQSRHRAAITLQAHWRFYCVRKIYGWQLQHLKQHRLEKMFRSAQLLQSLWRGFATRKKYGPVLETRRALRQEKLRREAEIRNQCATRIQALWKGVRARRIHGPALYAIKEERLREALRMKEELNCTLNAKAGIIQANWRGHFVRKTYTPLLRERMRIWREERSKRRNFAATKLQAHWRGHCERQRTGQWLVEEKRKKRELEEKQQKAACLLQAYWRMHCCRKHFLQHRKSKSNEVVSQPKRTSPSPSGKLTVSRRLESALSLRSHKITTIIPKHRTTTNSDTTSTNEGLAFTTGDKGDKDGGIVQQEEEALMSLQVSRQRETSAAQQARTKMTQAIMHLEAERALQEKQTSVGYQNELSNSSTLVPAQVWLDVVHQRLQQWFISITPWKDPPPPLAVGEPVPIPIARHQPVTKAVSRADLLAASSEETSPSRVEHVLLNGCGFVPDVGSLSCCHQLCSLDIINCGLSSLTSLPSNLPLTALNVQGNNLEQVDLQSVGPTLRFLNLSENKLGSVHGLERCYNLLDLDISGNRITRLGGLGCCCHLQSLSSNSNLLVSTAGLEGLPYLQTLSCARNHLPVAPDVSHSSLLTMLHLQQNNLQEVPRLPHHVVLRELRLEDNSLTDVSPLCQAWLPLLQTLSLARNCITHLDSLLPLIMLNILDISNNSVYDLPMLLRGLHGCMELRSVSVVGNPVAQEPQLHSHLISVLPSLNSVDDEPLYHPLPKEKFELPDLVTSSQVHQLCKRQLLEQDNMKKQHIETVDRMAREIPQRARQLMGKKVEQSKQFESLLIQHVKQQEELGRKSVGVRHEEGLVTQPAHECSPSEDTDKLTSAVIVIQALWRGHVARARVRAIHHAVVVIQTWWRGILACRTLEQMRQQRRKCIWAATVIQAVYRGYWLRCKLCEVMQHAKYVSDEENSLEEDIDLNMDEEDLLGDVLPLSPPTPVCPPITSATDLSDSLHDYYTGLQNYPLGEPLISYQRSGVTNSPEDIFGGSGAEWSGVKETGGNWGPPTQAWTEGGYRTSTVSVSRSSTQHSSPIPERRVVKEHVVDEWGFQTDTTVNLLMKRARRQKKLKNKAAKRKRMADPAERLAEFQRKGHLVMASTGPHSHHWRQHTPHTQVSSSKIYQWHHDHTVIHKDVISGQLPRNLEQKSKHEPVSSTSSCSLPQLDQRVLAGYAPTLVLQGHDSHCGVLQQYYESPISSEERFQPRLENKN